MIQRWGKHLLVVGPVVGLLVWVAQAISWQEVGQTLAQLSARDLLILAAVNLAILATFTIRWWIFLRVQGASVSYLRLLGYRLTAFGISYFTPGPHFGGEPYQVYAVARGHGVPAAWSLAAVTLDKIVEMLVNFAVLTGGVLVLVWHSDGPEGGRAWPLLAAVLLLLALPCAHLAALAAGRRPLSALVRRLGKLIRRPLHTAGWAQGLLRSEEQAGWLCRTHPYALLPAMGATLVSWLGIVFEFWLVARLMGVLLSPIQVVTVLVAARIATLLPLPAGLGALEASQSLAMQNLGLDPSIGVALALVIRGRDVLIALGGLALGGVQVWRQVAQAPGPVDRGVPVPGETRLDTTAPMPEPPHAT